MKVFLCLFVVIILFCQNLYTIDRKIYKRIKLTYDLSKIEKKEEIKIDLYSSEKADIDYVNFLLKNNLLCTDAEKFYEIHLKDKSEKWLVLLFLSEKSDTNVIVETFDYPLEYAFYLDKKNGEISDFYLIKQQPLVPDDFK